jgi:hypothetical protein
MLKLSDTVAVVHIWISIDESAQTLSYIRNRSSGFSCTLYTVYIKPLCRKNCEYPPLFLHAQMSVNLFLHMLQLNYCHSSYLLTLQQHLTCGSIMSGQRSELDRMVAFSVDILSLGRPSLFQTAI